MPKRERSTATTSTLARVNQTAIIEALRGMGALSRQQLGALTGLSPATINRLTATLIEEGAVVQAGHVPSTGGRPAVLLRYAGGTRVVAAIQVRADRATGILVDFDGQVIFRREVDFGPQLTAQSSGGAGAEERERDSNVRLEKTLALFDDLIATGGTMLAAINLLQRLGANVVEAAAIIDLPDLGGSAKVAATGTPLFTVCQYGADTP